MQSHMRTGDEPVRAPDVTAVKDTKTCEKSDPSDQKPSPLWIYRARAFGSRAAVGGNEEQVRVFHVLILYFQETAGFCASLPAPAGSNLSLGRSRVQFGLWPPGGSIARPGGSPQRSRPDGFFIIVLFFKDKVILYYITL